MLAWGLRGPRQAGRVSRCPGDVTVVSEAPLGLEMIESGDGLAGTDEGGVRPVSLMSSKLIILFAADDRYDNYLKREIPLYPDHYDLMFGSRICVYQVLSLLVHRRLYEVANKACGANS